MRDRTLGHPRHDAPPSPPRRSPLGQDRFDAVSLIRRGRNHGWPLVEGRGDTHGGRFVNSKVTWPTDEASPAGAAIAKGAL